MEALVGCHTAKVETPPTCHRVRLTDCSPEHSIVVREPASLGVDRQHVHSFND